MERINSDMEKVKSIAKKAGLDYPDAGLAPPRSGVHVPRVGRTITDSLHHSSAQNMFPVPDISEFLDILPDDEANLKIFKSHLSPKILISEKNPFEHFIYIKSFIWLHSCLPLKISTNPNELLDTLSKTFFPIPQFNSGIHHFTLLK